MDDSIVWVVRHGERADVADPNWEKTAARPHDPPLTPLGIAQAEATGRALAGARPLHGPETADPGAIFTSPFLRCVETAAAIAKVLGLQVCVEPGLSEIMNAAWFTAHPVDAGMATSALSTALGDDSSLLDSTYIPLYDSTERATTLESTHRLTFPESPLEAAARYVRTYEALRAQQRCVVLVTHGFAVQAIADTCDADVLECSFCSLTRLRRAPTARWVCDVVCSTSHLV